MVLKRAIEPVCAGLWFDREGLGGVQQDQVFDAGFGIRAFDVQSVRDVTLHSQHRREKRSSPAGYLRGDAGYEEARSIWNAVNVRRPGLVVRCAGPNEVVQAVRLATENRLLVPVRGGGHNIAGNAVCEGGLMIDLSPMTPVRVDPAARAAWGESGTTLGGVDRETQAHGRATLTDVNSTTGIAGLALGGWRAGRLRRAGAPHPARRKHQRPCPPSCGKLWTLLYRVGET